jgi:peptidoglycan/LPS O-acetylase OafA/YrhL
MYLLHMLAINAARRIAPGWGAGAFFVLGSLVTVVLASISYWLLERPILRIKERFESRLTPAITGFDRKAADHASCQRLRNMQ